MSEVILQTQELTRRYGHTVALDRASITVEKGQIFGLVGRNGAGKTTLIRLISGQSVPTSGQISLFGQTSDSSLNKARSRTGAMVEIPSFYPYLTARQNLEYYRIQRGIPGKNCVEEALELVNLTDTGKKKFKTFSLGMKQRLGLALALMNQPEFLLLDEPINGLDPEGIVEFRELLLRLNRERQTTILISSHITSDLEKAADYIAYLHQGKLLLCEEKDRLLEEYGRLACSEAELSVVDASFLAGVRRGKFSCEALVKHRVRFAAAYPHLTVERVGLDDIMVFINRAEKERGAEA